MLYVEVLITSRHLDGGSASYLKDGISVTFRHWPADTFPLLTESRLWAYLDWSVPGSSGAEICRQLRSVAPTSQARVLMVFNDQQLLLTRRALEAGADAYVVGQPSRRKILETITSEYKTPGAFAPRILTHRELVIDEENARVLYKGHPVLLAPNELRLLMVFVNNPGCVFSKPQLISCLNKERQGIDDRTMFRAVSRLRIALRDAGADDMIRTVRSAGYVMDLHS